MSRGVRKSTEDRIKDINADIHEMEQKRDSVQKKIDSLFEQKQELLDDLQSKKVAELAKVLDQMGKTPEDIISLLKA